MTYALETARGALLSGAPPAASARPLLILAAFAVVTVAVGTWTFRAGLRRARRDGSLSWY